MELDYLETETIQYDDNQREFSSLPVEVPSVAMDSHGSDLRITCGVICKEEAEASEYCQLLPGMISGLDRGVSKASCLNNAFSYTS